MNDMNLSNMTIMNVGEIVNSLAKSYICLIKKEIEFKKFPSVMLWGPPGVGKSQSVREIAKLIEEKTKKKVNVTDVRLLLFNPIDLRGIPTSNPDKTLAIWLKPKIFQMDDSKNVVNILFLDEISACPQSVQAAAYQITLDRVVGEHKLPSNCIVIAAGNRVTDKSVVNKMPKALANRLLHIEVETDVKSWFEWAKKSNINPIVLKFLSEHQDLLMNFEADNEDLAYATPRTWEMVSEILNNIDDIDVDIVGLIGGLVGKDVAIQFSIYLKLDGKIPSIKDIFSGKVKYKKMTNEELYYLKSGIINYIKAKDLSDDEIYNSVKYIMDMPNDYSLLIMKSYLYISDEIKMRLLNIPEVAKWLKKEGKLINDIK